MKPLCSYQIEDLSASPDFHMVMRLQEVGRSAF
jgi:hypothetical protein